jgi:hypothetical protein
MRALILAFACFVALAAVGCGGTRYMEPSARLEAPPEGKALVNVHRPSTAYGAGADLVVWDGEKVIGNTNGKDLFQFVADPGQHLFHAKQANVSVIKADLAAGKTYDVVVDCGPNLVPFQANYRLWLNPIGKGSERRAQVEQWLGREKTLALSAKAEGERITYQERHLDDARQYLRDFTEGAKRDKLGILSSDDGR